VRQNQASFKKKSHQKVVNKREQPNKNICKRTQENRERKPVCQKRCQYRTPSKVNILNRNVKRITDVTRGRNKTDWDIEFRAKALGVSM